MSARSPSDDRSTRRDNVVLRLKSIRKSYGSTLALRDATVDLAAGEVLGLVGENGSGKSTLLRVIAGLEMPDAGTLTNLRGRRRTGGLSESARHGIGMVFQELAVVPTLRVYENFFLPAPRINYHRGLLRRGHVRRACREALARHDIEVDPDAYASDLSFGQRQMVEIVRALELPRLVGTARHTIVLLDEPTTALDQHEIDQLFALMRRARSSTAFVFVSHRLAETLAISDRIVVLRDGVTVAERDPHATSEAELHGLMVGRDRALDYFHAAERAAPKTQIGLALDKLSGPGYCEVSLAVRSGEIVGLAGVEASGRSAVLEAVHGLRRVTAGSVSVTGERVAHPRAVDQTRRGVAYLPKERLAGGIIPSSSIRANIGLHLARNRVLTDRRAEVTAAREVIATFRVRTNSPDMLLDALSGGNQQKVALGKWLVTRPRVLLLDNPTRGVDIGARSEIYLAVLLASDELSELLGLCDAVHVMRDGRISHSMTLASADSHDAFDHTQLAQTLVEHMV